jgi:hypothetical protein
MGKAKTNGKIKLNRSKNGTPPATEKRGIRPMIAFPIERNVHQKAFLAFTEVVQMGLPIFQSEYQRTDVARNRAGLALLNSEFTHVLMLDSDHIHTQDVVKRLLFWALRDPSIEVVGGLNFRRTEPYDPLAFTLGSDGKYYPPTEWPEGLVKVDAIATCALLISRTVFERGDPPWFYYDYSRAAEDVYPSEDMGFAKWCREHGVQQYCDTTCTSPHLTDQLVTADTFKTFYQAHQEKFLLWDDENKRPVETVQSGDVYLPDIVTRVDV